MIATHVSAVECCRKNRGWRSIPVFTALQRRTHTDKDPAGARSEEFGRSTPGLHSDERDPNIHDRREREDRGAVVQQPSETAIEHTSGGGQDVDDPIQLGKSRGKSQCSGYTIIHFERGY